MSILKNLLGWTTSNTKQEKVDQINLQSDEEVLVEEISQSKEETLIAEIHQSFFTEVDNLLAQAKILKSLDSDKDELIKKAERLRNLGFGNTKEVLAANTEIKRLDELKKENKDKEELIEAINYFSFQYPHYKFITEESVKSLCSKYQLVYGPVDKFTGVVPEKNLKYMEDFKIKSTDEPYVLRIHNFNYGHIKYEILNEDLFKQMKDNLYNNLYDNLYDHAYGHKSTFIAPLEIVAPVKDFSMSDWEINAFKLVEPTIVVRDPIVLKPVHYKFKKYYLIVTAWGLEASDELVINEKNN